MFTYNARIKFDGKDRLFTLKMAKDKADHTIQTLKRPAQLAQYYRETTGIVGDDESTADLFEIFSVSGSPRDPESWKVKTHAYLDEWSANGTGTRTITEADYPAIKKGAHEIYEAHIRLVDARKTPEEIAERNQKNQEYEQARQQEQDAWLAEHAGPDVVTLNPGDTAITLSYCYDGSDPMTDYFDRHHGWGSELVLALLSGKAREDERTLRDVLERYPALKVHNFTWHTEKYSMGHGNYLESGYINQDTPEGKGLHLEIEYTHAWRAPREFRTAPLYPGVKPAWSVTAPAADTKSLEINGITFTYEGTWTWAKFPSKPAPETLTKCKELGGRFSGKRMAWYFTRPLASEETALLAPAGVRETPARPGER